MSSDLRFVQGPNVGTAGQALKGTLVDGICTVSNGNDTGVVAWTFELLYVPPGSALAPTTQGPSAAATFTFTPDVAGSYRFRLTTADGGGVETVDIRNFCVSFPNGLIAPPYQRNPTPLPLTGVSGKADEMNIGGQPFGWDGDDNVARMLLYQALQILDGVIAGTGEANTASNVGGGVGIWKQKTGVDLEFLSLVAGANISITPVGDTLSIAATGVGEANTASNVGGGSGVWKQKTGVDLEFLSLVGAANISITPVGNTLEISAAGAGVSNLNDLGDVTITSAAEGQVLSYDGASKWENKREKAQFIFTFEGNVAPATDVGPRTFVFTPKFFPLNVRIDVKTAPTTTGLQVDVLKNGTTIFSGGGPTIATSAFTASKVPLTPAFVTGDEIRINIDAGDAVWEDLTVSLQGDPIPG